MNKNIKTILLIISVIIVIAVIAIFGFNILNKNENVNETQNSINATSQNMQNAVNETETNVVNELQNNVIENEVENKQVENNVNNVAENVVTNQTTEVLEDDGASNEEKAINIVKKDWGTTEGVYFVTMGIDASGKYIVTVNDSSTTATLAWYRSRCSYWKI